MAENKTKPTEASVAEHLAAIPDASRRADCEVIADLMRKVTKHEPVMWGPSIVGFDRYRYQYESGHGGECCQTGFASRKSDISVYLIGGFPEQAELLAKLGKHKMGKACLYIRRISDVDLKVLEALIAGSVAAIRKRYGNDQASA